MQKNGKLFKKGIISLLSIAIGFSAFSIGFSSWALSGDEQEANLSFIADAVKIDSVSFEKLNISPNKVTYDAKQNDNEGRVQYKVSATNGESLKFIATGTLNKCEYVGKVDFSLLIEDSKQKAIYDNLVKKGYVQEPNFKSLSIYDSATSIINENYIGYYWTTNTIDGVRNFKVIDTFLWGAKFNYKNPGEFFDSNDLSLTDNKIGNDYSYTEICDILDDLYQLNDIKYTIVATAKPKKYNVIYDLDGGEFGPDNSNDILFTEKYAIPTKKPTKTGYEFVGYSNEKDGTVKYNLGQTFNISDMAIGSSSDIVLYAIWAAKIINITYNDGSGNTYVDTIHYGDEYTFKTPSECGFNLSGDVSWTIGNKTYTPGETIVINNNSVEGSSNGSVTFIGKVVEKVQITYQYSEGGYESKTFTIIKGENYKVLSFGELGWKINDGYIFAGWSGNGSTYNGGETINNVINDIVFKLTYVGKEITVTFNSNGGSINGKDTYVTKVNYGSTLNSFPTAIKANATFIKWNLSSDGKGLSIDNATIFNNTLNANLSTSSSIVIYANYIDDIKLILNYDSDKLLIENNATSLLQYDQTFKLPSVTSKYGFSFDSWYFDSGYTNKISQTSLTFSELSKYVLNGKVNLYAKAKEAIKFSVSIDISGKGKGTVTIENKTNGSIDTVSSSDTIDYFQSSALTISAKADDNSSISKFTINNVDYKDKQPYTTDSLSASLSIVAEFDDGCILPTTNVLLSDGTYKYAGDLRSNDKVLSFNHETGKFESSRIIINDHIDSLATERNILYLKFSNDDEIGIAYNHGFFSVEDNKYVYLSIANYLDYIGKEFISVNYNCGYCKFEKVKLVGGTVKKEFTKVCSPATYKNLDIVTESILSIAGGIDGMFNYFEYDENLKFDEELMKIDINTYGLFTYEDFENKISYDIYEAFNAKYLKVSIGKGLLTDDLLNYYIKRYAAIIKEQN